MKSYYAKKKFEYTNGVGEVLTAHPGDLIQIYQRSEEKKLLKEGAIKDTSQVPVGPQTMTTMTVKGKGQEVDPVLLDDEEEEAEDDEAPAPEDDEEEAEPEKGVSKQTTSRARKNTQSKTTSKKRGRPRKYPK